MKLNLGAGRVIFPAERSHPPNHLMPLPEIVFGPGWVNVDKYANPGIGEAVDLFCFPWIRSSNGNPWNDNSVEAIYCSHLIEHIPHRVDVSRKTPLNWQRDYSEMCDRLDGWFVFFYECWRILKPGGLMHIVTPFGLSSAALCDPTHTRYIVPGAFSYFSPSADAPFDYHLPCRFEAEAEPLLRIRGHWVEKLNDLTPEQVNYAAHTYFDVCDEFRITLRAVKDDQD